MDFFALIMKAVDDLVVPTVSMYEVFEHLLAQRGEESALQAVWIMSSGVVADLSREVAINAALSSFKLKTAMADSIILATARAYDAILWTQDADFEGMEGVRYIARRG
jgi:predicted nucleic acid-binding protein